MKNQKTILNPCFKLPSLTRGNSKGVFHTFRKIFLITTVLLCLTSLLAPFLVSAQEDTSLKITTPISASALISLTNQARANNGLKTLRVNSLLNQAANAKLTDMFANNYFAHTSPSGLTGWYFIRTQGYRYSKAGENLAKDFMTSEGIFDAWMASPSHRANILESSFQEIGIATRNGKIDGQDTTLTVQFFGIPLRNTSVAPSTGGNYQNYSLPVAPQITAPKNNCHLNDGHLTIKGKAEANQTIEIQLNQDLLQTKTNSKGKFAYQFASPLADGSYKLKARVKVSDSLKSKWTQPLKFTLDTQKPEIKSFTLLPNQVHPDQSASIVLIASEKLDSATIQLNQKTIPLTKLDQFILDPQAKANTFAYTASLLTPWEIGSYPLQVALTDRSGNLTKTILDEPLQVVNQAENTSRNEAKNIPLAQSMLIVSAFVVTNALALLIP
jgi:uncharacterized protein YkwD